jgi:AraC-like DNA-binding protein
MNTNTKIKVAMAVMAAVMMLSTSAVAFAQGSEPPTPPTPPVYGQTFWQTFADKLGVSVDKLQGALREALKATVGQALKDGKLTQSQADTANGRIDKMTFDKPLFGQFLGERRRDMLRVGFALGKEGIEAAAAKLGMTPRDLMTELRAGKSLADVAQAKNVSVDDLKAAILAAVNAQIDQAVKDGKLTQAQADQAKSKVATELDLSKKLPEGWLGGKRPFMPRGPKPTQPPTQ